MKAFRVWLVFWKKSFDFSGIATRKEAWTALGFNVASIFIIRFILVDIVQHAVLSLDLFVIEFFDSYSLAYANKFRGTRPIQEYSLTPLYKSYTSKEMNVKYSVVMEAYALAQHRVCTSKEMHSNTV